MFTLKNLHFFSHQKWKFLHHCNILDDFQPGIPATSLCSVAPCNKAFSFCMCCFLTPWCSLTVALICDDGVSGASGKASSAQSRICFAALPCSVAAGFRLPWQKCKDRVEFVQGRAEPLVQPGLHPIPSVSLTSWSLSYEKMLSSHRTDWV